MTPSGVSGTAFTAPRAANLRTWLYRRRPSVQAGGYRPLAHAWLKSGARGGVAAPPDPMRWHPIAVPDARDEPQSHALNARLVLLLANHVGSLPVLREALGAARASTLGEPAPGRPSEATANPAS